MGETVTVHGFRSSFRDWTFDKTNYKAELVEIALSHYKGIGDATVVSYLRSDGLEQRRRLAQDWATYCEPIVEAVPATEAA